jgi:hypothetical protein
MARMPSGVDCFIGLKRCLDSLITMSSRTFAPKRLRFPLRQSLVFGQQHSSERNANRFRCLVSRKSICSRFLFVFVSLTFPFPPHETINTSLSTFVFKRALLRQTNFNGTLKAFGSDRGGSAVNPMKVSRFTYDSNRHYHAKHVEHPVCHRRLAIRMH